MSELQPEELLLTVSATITKSEMETMISDSELSQLIKEPFRREETFALLAKELAKSAEAYLERPYGMENEALRFALYEAIEAYDNYVGAWVGVANTVGI